LGAGAKVEEQSTKSRFGGAKSVLLFHKKSGKQLTHIVRVISRAVNIYQDQVKQLVFRAIFFS